MYDLFGRALPLGRHAVTLRYTAVQNGDLSAARNASASAAGGLQLFERALDQLDLALRLPQLSE